MKNEFIDKYILNDDQEEINYVDFSEKIIQKNLVELSRLN